jgi:Flp pilus assembly protein TadB
MNNQYFWDRFVGRDPNLRAADADRERIAERLRKSHAEGRLDMTEFQQRLERCYEAKTFGQLDELVKDLPRQDELDERRTFEPLRPWRVARLAAMLLALIVVLAAIGHHIILLWIPLLFVIWRVTSWRRRRWLAGGRRFPDEPF